MVLLLYAIGDYCERALIEEDSAERLAVYNHLYEEMPEESK
jgi:hypothetical protein